MLDFQQRQNYIFSVSWSDEMNGKVALKRPKLGKIQLTVQIRRSKKMLNRQSWVLYFHSLPSLGLPLKMIQSGPNAINKKNAEWILFTICYLMSVIFISLLLLFKLSILEMFHFSKVSTYFFLLFLSLCLCAIHFSQLNV